MKKICKTVLHCCYILVSCMFLLACDTTQSYQAVHNSKYNLLSIPETTLIQHRHFERNPVIVIHGLLGGKLKNPASNKSIWGDFSWKRMNDSSYVAQIAMPMKRGISLNQIQSNAVPDGILDVTTIAYRDKPLIYLESYSALTNKLEELGYFRADNVKNLDVELLPPVFTFSYDWRRDISLNVVELHKFIEEKERELQKIYKEKFGLENYKIKFDIIAHSMGGLLARYYLQYGPQILSDNGELPAFSDIGSDKIEKTIIVGTPNFGYVDTFSELCRGLVLYPGLKAIPPAILGTFSSYYFMLPVAGTSSVIYADNYEELDLYDIELWKKYKWGLANNDENSDKLLSLILPEITDRAERQQVALEHLEKNLKQAKLFHQALKKELPKDKNTLLYLFAGNSFKTRRSLLIDRESGKIVGDFNDSGDGKVSLSSALYDSRAFKENRQLFMTSPIHWTAIYNCGASHMGIFSSQAFWSNLSTVLLTEATARQQELIYKDR